MLCAWNWVALKVTALLFWGIAFGFFSFSTQAGAAVPEPLKNTGITEKLGQKIPQDLQFTDDQGVLRPLSYYFQKASGKPVVLALVYYNCPNLCTFVLNGLVETLKKIDWLPGRDFEILTLSINHNEKPDIAAQKKSAYLNEYGKSDASSGWHFLTGDETSIRALADSVGFGFQYDPRDGQYAHSAALIILTPEGVLSRYLFGIEYKPSDFRLALVEASKGKVGTVIDRLILFCYRYDPRSRGYSLQIARAMQVAGALTAIFVGVFLFMFWRKQRFLQDKTL
jgi:protein SCO1/2